MMKASGKVFSQAAPDIWQSDAAWAGSKGARIDNTSNYEQISNVFYAYVDIYQGDIYQGDIYLGKYILDAMRL